MTRSLLAHLDPFGTHVIFRERRLDMVEKASSQLGEVDFVPDA
jgi:hypothetical protein